MLRALVLIAFLLASAWQSVALARVGSSVVGLADVQHTQLHAQQIAHQHHEDGSYQLDNSLEAAQHVMLDHLNPSVVVGYVIKGSWRYLEHDWVARAGSFVYEPPGEIHTLVVDEASGPDNEMITFFNISGAMVYVDATGQPSGYEDVFTKLEMCRQHYTQVGLGADYVDQFVR